MCVTINMIYCIVYVYSDRDKFWLICYLISQGKQVKTYPGHKYLKATSEGQKQNTSPHTGTCSCSESFSARLLSKWPPPFVKNTKGVVRSPLVDVNNGGKVSYASFVLLTRDWLPISQGKIFLWEPFWQPSLLLFHGVALDFEVSNDMSFFLKVSFQIWILDFWG